MIRKTIIVILTLAAIASGWLGFISIPIFSVGIIAFLATSPQPTMRRRARLTGGGLSLVLLTLWLASMRYAFGYIGSSGAVYFEWGSYAVFATHGQIPATGWMGVGRSRGDISWWLSCPAMIPMTPVWIPLSAALLPTCLLSLGCRELQPGHCLHCEYDLAGNESGVCPECGTKVATL